MKLTTAHEIFTSGDIASALGRSRTQVRWILNSRTHIEPVGRVGITRVYDARAIKLVQVELALIDERRATLVEPAPT